MAVFSIPCYIFQYTINTLTLIHSLIEDFDLVTVEASVFVQLNCSKKYSCRSSTYHQFKAEYQNYHIYISSMQAILNQIIARKKRVHKYAPFKTESIFIQNSNTR